MPTNLSVPPICPMCHAPIEDGFTHTHRVLTSVGSIFDPNHAAKNSAPPLPTLEEINKALADFNAAVDKEDVLGGTVYAAVCTGVLERVRDAMQSGALRVREEEGQGEGKAASK